MTESLYDIDEKLIMLVKSKIPNEFIYILENGYSKVKRLHLRL